MRPTRDFINMESALLQSKRGKCLRLYCGCVITQEGRIISSGYNGSVIHNQSCRQLGCNTANRCEHSAHAEENAIAFASRQGISLFNSVMYVTTCPCYKCARLIIQSGISEVVYLKDYKDLEGKEDWRGLSLLQAAGLIVRKYNQNHKTHHEQE